MKKIDKPLYESLGRQLKEARLKKGYSLEFVGDMVGKSKVSVKRYEDGKMRVDNDTLDRICSVLDVKPLRINPTIEPVPNFVDALLINFLKLDTDAQRIVLMMLKFDNVDEIMEILKE